MFQYQMHTELSPFPLSALLQHIHQLLDQLKLLKTSNSGHWKVSKPYKDALNPLSLLSTSNNINEEVDKVSSYITFCVDNIVPSKTVTIFPNNKPCITKELKEILNRKTRIFFTGSELEIKKVNKEVKRAIKIAKLRYKNKVEQKLIDGNLRSACQGLNTMASINTGDINPRTIRVEGSSSTSLPDDLNSFYTRFESDNSIQLEVIRSELNPDNSAFTFSTQDLLRALRRTREWSSPGLHNISGHVLRHCAQQLQDVFQVLFQRSMESSTVPQLWKHSTVIPIPKKSKTTALNDLRPVALTSRDESNGEDPKTSHYQSKGLSNRSTSVRISCRKRC